ncbi:hypothetical protein [Nonomuraea sp. NPDC005650]|uniref:hypothetical protein n=1 Tax=Nonomuraea sp. NPDC005650 TaxID=3157045 RepID=UPI0033A8A266
MTDRTPGTPPPGPRTPAEFVAGLRRLKAWSGLTYRQLEARATAAGDCLPYSTLASAFGRNRLPRRELVGAFTRACGCRPEETAAWLDAHRGLATQAVTAPAASPGDDPVWPLGEELAVLGYRLVMAAASRTPDPATEAATRQIIGELADLARRRG